MRHLITLLAAIMFLPLASNAQRYMRDDGGYNDWRMPNNVFTSISYEYRGYDVIHARRVDTRSNVSFDVVLQKGDVYFEVSVGNDGRIYRRQRRTYSPLRDHHCSHHCGYHEVYYKKHHVHGRHPGKGHYKKNHKKVVYVKEHCHDSHCRHDRHDHYNDRHDHHDRYERRDRHDDRRDRHDDRHDHDDHRKSTPKKGKRGNTSVKVVVNKKW
ncbi:hypothetical protein V6R21_23140 [Limibacter armeniacum]|uniref:hypothetical protein n=1 Tax=Limibacter armeniacum TaxID=466084 RepID=UPI002FE5143F